MYRIVNVEPNSIEHMEFRKGKIGSSIAADIMGVGYNTPLQRWNMEIFGNNTPPNPAMLRGTALEPVARKKVCDLLGIDYRPVVIENVENPILIASLDGFCEVDGFTHILEIKCPNAERHALAVQGKVPEIYYPQLQHIMLVSGVDFMIYASFNGEDVEIVRVEKDEKYCEKLLAEEMAFYKLIVDLKEPKPTEKDWAEIKDPVALEKAQRYIELSKSLKEAEKELDDLESDLKGFFSHPRNRVGDLSASKIVRQGAIDYKAIPELSSVNLEPYRKAPVSFWKFS